MAVIGKIRNQMGILLVVFVGVALLAFVLGDFLSSAGYFFNGDRSTVGKMNGKSVKIDEFDLKLRQNEAAYSRMNPEGTISDETRTNLLDQTWQEFVEQNVWEKEFDEVGVRISTEELQDMFGGRFIHPYIQQIPVFTNPQTGAFDPVALQNFLTVIATEPTDLPEDQLAQWRQQRAQWENVETAVEKSRLQTKYQTLVEKGLYVTDKEVARQYAENGDRFNIRYVGRAFSEVPDSTVQVTDEDLKKAYDENKNRFKSDFAVRGIRYALFEILPTAKDSAALYATIAAVKPGFEASTDDTSFLYQNSDLQKDPRYLRSELLPKEVDSMLFNAPKGTVYGPYVDAGAYFLAKKLDEKTSADSVKVRAILIAKNTNQGPRAEAKPKADSIFAAIKAGADMKVLAATKSEDQQTAPDSGNVGWIAYEMPGNPIIDSAYNAPVGELRMVETPEAFAIVRAEEKTAPVRKALIAFISKDIKASDETVSAAFTAASDFALANKTAEDFEKAAQSGKFVIREDNFLRENAKTVTGLPESKSLVKWAFEKNVGDVSAVEQFQNKYVVAILLKARNAGVPKFDEIKTDLEPFAKRDKKAAQFIEEMKGAAGSGNIDQVGTAVKKPVIPATDITFASYGVPGAGFEPGIIGAASGAAKGKLFGPFQGVNGVYVVVVDAINKGANPPAGPQQKLDMSRMVGQRAFSEAFEALNSAAEVRDLRHKFY